MPKVKSKKRNTVDKPPSAGTRETPSPTVGTPTVGTPTVGTPTVGTAKDIFRTEGMAPPATGEVDHLTWKEYFMGMAAMASRRSKALHYKYETRHGAVLVNKDNKIVGVGYNGMPLNIPDKGRLIQHQKDLTCDEHTNAVLFRSVTDLGDCDMYATRFPTWGSAKVLIQSKIENLFFMSKGRPVDMPEGTRPVDNYEEIKEMLLKGGVTLIQLKPVAKRTNIIIDFLSFGQDDIEVEPESGGVGDTLEQP